MSGNHDTITVRTTTPMIPQCFSWLWFRDPEQQRLHTVHLKSKQTAVQASQSLASVLRCFSERNRICEHALILKGLRSNRWGMTVTLYSAEGKKVWVIANTFLSFHSVVCFCAQIEQAGKHEWSETHFFKRSAPDNSLQDLIKWPFLVRDVLHILGMLTWPCCSELCWWTKCPRTFLNFCSSGEHLLFLRSQSGLH